MALKVYFPGQFVSHRGKRPGLVTEVCGDQVRFVWCDDLNDNRVYEFRSDDRSFEQIEDLPLRFRIRNSIGDHFRGIIFWLLCVGCGAASGGLAMLIPVGFWGLIAIASLEKHIRDLSRMEYFVLCMFGPLYVVAFSLLMSSLNLSRDD